MINTMLDLKSLCHKVESTAKKAGRLIQMEGEKFDRNHIEQKVAGELVSYVDKEAEECIVEDLKEYLPEAGFVTEENTINKKGERYHWIVDPLDGTTNFMHGIPVYAVSIALMDDKEIILGVVYEINGDECFTAWKEGGAYLNGEPIRVSDTKLMKDAVMATGFPYDLEDKSNRYLEMMRDVLMNSRGMRRLGSAATDMCYVACGRYDGYFEFNIKLWDVAAGIIIIEEAGGKCSDFSGVHGNWENREMACTGNVQDELIEVIQRHYWGK